MRICLTALALALVPATAWAGLGLPNELSNPSFEGTTGWTVSGPVNAHIPYSTLAPFGIGAPAGGGSYCGGVAGQSLNFPGGEISQVVDQSQFASWHANWPQQQVEVDFSYRQLGLADVPMNINVYLDYMQDGSYPDPQSPLYVKQLIKAVTNTNSNGWKLNDTDVTLPVNPRYLSVHFEFTYFTGTGINIVDLVDVQAQSVPEPATLSVLGLGGLLLRRRRNS